MADLLRCLAPAFTSDVVAFISSCDTVCARFQVFARGEDFERFQALRLRLESDIPSDVWLPELRGKILDTVQSWIGTYK